uniref:Uncharacterized protein n=1 Tax=Romanomermis culicivorax TaxID=13658 RepID=A0A915KYB0_ROMCU
MFIEIEEEAKKVALAKSCFWLAKNNATYVYYDGESGSSGACDLCGRKTKTFAKLIHNVYLRPVD